MTDDALCKAVDEMERGLIDADLGGNILKKRVAVSSRGKRGGSRTLVATNRGDRWCFVYGFMKNVRANISARELTALRSFGEDLLALTPEALKSHIASGALEEICDG
ncbi:type II toxin-antitoxin system RelE/ParE family toxin [Endothiovibrio diazotrophicus]